MDKWDNHFLLKSLVLSCSITLFFSIPHHELYLRRPTDVNLAELPELSALSSCMHPHVFYLISVEKVFFLLFHKFIFPSVPWIFLPSSRPCSIGHSFLLSWLSSSCSFFSWILLDPASYSSDISWSLWLPALREVLPLCTFTVSPTFLEHLAFGVCLSGFLTAGLGALKVPTISYLSGVGVKWMCRWWMNSSQKVLIIFVLETVSIRD